MNSRPPNSPAQARKNLSATNSNSFARAKPFSLARNNSSKPQKPPSTALAESKTRVEDWVFHPDYSERILREQFGVAELTGFGLDDHPQALSAAGAVVHYLRENSARGDDAPSLEALRHLDRIRYYELHDALILDPVSVRNLELVSPIFTEESKSAGPTTLIAALDSTVTGMGARMLRAWMLRPLIDLDAIDARLGAVAHLLQQHVVRGEIRKELRGIQDLERLTSRITLGLATPREASSPSANLSRSSPS